MKANRDYLFRSEKLTATHKTKETIKRVESLMCKSPDEIQFGTLYINDSIRFIIIIKLVNAFFLLPWPRLFDGKKINEKDSQFPTHTQNKRKI